MGVTLENFFLLFGGVFCGCSPPPLGRSQPAIGHLDQSPCYEEVPELCAVLCASALCGNCPRLGRSWSLSVCRPSRISLHPSLGSAFVWGWRFGLPPSGAQPEKQTAACFLFYGDICRELSVQERDCERPLRLLPFRTQFLA